MAGSTSGISPSFLELSRSSGQVTHVLLTRSRLCPRPKPGSSLHLHVLGTPPAFVLSQDQTLREELRATRPLPTAAEITKSCRGPSRDTRRTRACRWWQTLASTRGSPRTPRAPGHKTGSSILAPPI